MALLLLVGAVDRRAAQLQLARRPNADRGRARGLVREELLARGVDVPERTPGAITRTFSGPNGSHFGSHSSSRIRADKARPPKIFQSAGNGSNDVVCVVMSTRRIRSPLDSGIKAPPIRESHYANLLPRGSTRPNEAPVRVSAGNVSSPQHCGDCLHLVDPVKQVTERLAGRLVNDPRRLEPGIDRQAALSSFLLIPRQAVPQHRLNNLGDRYSRFGEQALGAQLALVRGKGRVSNTVELRE